MTKIIIDIDVETTYNNILFIDDSIKDNVCAIEEIIAEAHELGEDVKGKKTITIIRYHSWEDDDDDNED